MVCQLFFSRRQSVVCNGQKSELKLMGCGVPQRFMIRYFFFLFETNDLGNVLNFFMFILFDDINRFCRGTGLNDMIRRVNEEITKIYACGDANRPSVNVDGTNFMFFTPKIFV